MRVCSSVAVGLLVGSIAVLSACRSEPTPVPYARLYPMQLKQSSVLDVQVFRHQQELELTNTSADAFGPCTLWLNQRYSRPINGLGVGETLTASLSEFRDEFSIPFRAGGFFAVEPPDRLVLAQIEAPGADGKPTFYGLVVIGGRDE